MIGGRESVVDLSNALYKSLSAKKDERILYFRLSKLNRIARGVSEDWSIGIRLNSLKMRLKLTTETYELEVIFHMRQEPF